MSDAETRIPDPPSALPRGTRLHEFELRRVLGIGGFGIVYLAFDHALEREVAVKEYMPSSLVGRSGPLQVSLLSEANAEPFSRGLRSFVNEARLLARFDHPSLVKVHRYWEANGTAYMVMPFYGGRNLHATRRSMAQPPDEAWLRAILDPLLGAIERLHAEGVYHRDISPDNVILQPDGRPVLLDFGAARRVLGDKSMALTAILKPAYAPIEQYAEAGAVKQGPWTDLYALGGLLHFLLLGRAPMPATARTVDDQMPTLLSQQALLPGCSAGFLHCVDWMLQPRPADRPQQVAALRERLARLPPPLAPAPAAPGPDDGRWQATQRLTPATSADDTVLDPGLLPATLRVPPLDTRPTELLPRNEAEAATLVMPRTAMQPTERVARAPGLPASAEAGPGAPAAAPADQTQSPAAGAAPAALPRLSDPAPPAGVGLAADGLDRALPPGRAPARRWPLAVGLAGAAGLALWLGLRPAALTEAPAAAASAPGSAASVTAAVAASAAPAATAASTAAAKMALAASGPAAEPAGATSLPVTSLPPASPAEPPTPRSAARTAPAARPSAQPSGESAAARVPRANPVLPPDPADASAVAAPVSPPAHPGGLATSITRLPPADSAVGSPPATGPASRPTQ